MASRSRVTAALSNLNTPNDLGNHPSIGVKMITRAFFVLILMFGISAAVLAENSTIANGVVVQANARDSAEFKRALILASNMHEVLTKAQFEVVVYGPAVKYLSAFSDEQPLIQKLQSEGIKIIACGRSLSAENLKESDLAPAISVVPFGAVHIVNRQKQGWQYIRS